MSRPIAQTLERLNLAAGKILRIPLGFIDRDQLTELRTEVSEAIDKPAEGERVIDDIDLKLADLLVRIADEPAAGRGRLIRVARALHLEVQQDLRRAREEELRQMRSEATR